MASDKKSMERERKKLTSIIKQWNESRLDLFAISLPDENMECNGVMRFYHKDWSNNGKYATKCIRVSSNSSTKDVVEMLSTKFRPDMRMLTKPKYVINEVHVDGEMRLLKDKEKPLLVQLSWVKDDREGRFLLHNVDDKAPVRLMEQFIGPDNEDSSFKLTRNLTKKEKKLKKKQEKEKASKKNSNSAEDGSDPRQQEIYTVKHLYSQVPESTFTRTVSNPEAVMKKRREQKLQKRGANILKVYGDRINPEIPYKSLLLLPTDNVTTVIRDALDKYGLGKEKTQDYNIIQVVLPPNSKPDEMLDGGWGMETILHDPKCPLDIEQNWQPHEGTLVFQLRHIGAESKNVKRSSPVSSNISASDTDERTKKPASPEPINGNANGERSPSSKELPKLLELFPSSNEVREHLISPDVTEIGSDRNKAGYDSFIEISRNDIKPSHCVITNMDGVVSVTPQNRSEVSVDGKPIEETTMLSHGAIVRVGRGKDLVYCEPGGKISMPQVRKKMQGFSQPHTRSQDRYGNEQHRNPRGANHQPHRVADSRQKSASLPRELEDQPQHRNVPTSRGAPSSTSSSQSRQSSTMGHVPDNHTHQRNRILPATLQLRSGSEETFLTETVSVTGMNLHFKLSPAYAIYLSLRDIVEVTPKASLKLVLVEYLCTTTDLLDQTIQLNSRVTTELAFWMANASELLNFVRHDIDISPCTAEAQDTLAKTVQLAFRHLVQCMQHELYQLMPAFLSPSDEDLPGGSGSNQRDKSGDQPNMYNVLHMLSSAMSLLRRCRVNAALTIQLFSQLFHFVNMWIFNEVVTKPEKGLCCRSWGIKLRARLARIEAWAEKQGLELAADCHLARVTQAMHLLQAPKQTADDIANISSTCFKLNSLQLRALLSQYIPNERDGERRIPNELIDKVAQVARSTADELTYSDGREVRVEEDPDLQLPFLLPEDGYSCDVVQSVPSGLTEFARPLVAESVCAYHINPEASGIWTVHFLDAAEPQQPASGALASPSQVPPVVIEQPEMATVSFSKYRGGIGLSIVAARGPGQASMGIYVRAVVKGGAADRDGRLQAGDQLVSIDGHSLVGLSQEKAAEIMTKTGQNVTLSVAKRAALFHGLSALLEPSPEAERAAVTHRRPGSHQNHQPRPKSDGFALQQGYKPSQNPPHAKQDKRSHPVSNQRPSAQKPFAKKDHINKSTTQLIVMTTSYSDTENFDNKKTDFAYYRRDGPTRNHNTIARGYVPLNTPFRERDYLPSDKVSGSYDWEKSPSGHSVASSTTSDSGFQSTSMMSASMFNHSSNSAFSPRGQMKSETTSDSSRLDSTEMADFPPPLEYDADCPSTCSTDNNLVDDLSSTKIDSVIPTVSNGMEEPDNHHEGSRISSYATMPKSYRRRKPATQYSPRQSSDVGVNSGYSNNVQNTPTQPTKTTTKFRSDVLLKSFIEQAEERDRKARREQRSLTRAGRSRARSSAAYKRGAGRSSSVDTDNRISTGVRRSNSSVDIKKIISKAETRDRHARVEQARLQGVLPPRKYLPDKKPVRVMKVETAASIIQKYEEKKQDDDPFLKHLPEKPIYKKSLSYHEKSYRPFDIQSEYGAPAHSVVDDYKPYKTSQSMKSQKSPSSIHSDAGVNYVSARYVPRFREHSRSRTEDSDEERDRRKHPYVSKGMAQAPRPAMSMGNLQNTPDNDGPKSRALSDWQRTWEEKVAHSTYQRQRAKSSSSTALQSPNQTDGRQATADQYNRRKQVENLFKHGHVSPRQQEQKPPPGKAATMLSKSHGTLPTQNSLDNPNYQQLPPPPTPPPESPATSKSPESEVSQKESPREYSKPSPKGYKKPDKKANSPTSSQTMGRPASGDKKTKEPAKSAPKNDAKSRSSTLPRHFKSAAAWDADAQQRAIQEQLNILRDEEIDELSARIDSLSTLEKSRLNNLLKEREFQRRVEEESRRIFSDEDISDEGYEVPDRPDRDRLIQMQDDHAEQFDAVRVQEEEFRKEEERERKKQIERQRREEEEKERKLRERLEQERKLEQERLRQEEQRRQEEEERRQYEEEMKRREEFIRQEEKRKYDEMKRKGEEEERRRQEEKLRWRKEERMRWEEEQDRFRREEEERYRMEEEERFRREEEKRLREEERMRREKEDQERRRNQWLNEERERREREERQRQYKREQEEREREREKLQAEREAQEKSIHDAKMEREARLRAIRFENEQKRRRERRMKPSEEDEREEAERELLEKQLSMGKPSTFRKFNRPSYYGAASVFGRNSSTSGNSYQPPPPPTASKPVMRQNVNRTARPVSDGYFLGKTDHIDDDERNDLNKTSQNSTSTYNVSSVNDPSPASPAKNPVNYVTSHNTPRVIGAQERYRDPRDRREAQIKREQSLKRRQQEPSFLTFKDRQRLFSTGQNTPVDKPRASKKLLEIESNLKGQIS